jgi:hypothetical protein
LIQKEIPADVLGEFTAHEYNEAWVLAEMYFTGIRK